MTSRADSPARALVIANSSFGEELGSLDLTAGNDLATALEQCGWQISHKTELSADKMRAQLADVRDGRYWVLHILTHGQYKSRSEGLWLAGALANSTSATSDEWVDFRSWLSEAIDPQNEIPSLVIFLDTCYAGDAAQLDWLDEGRRKIFVFAATEPGQWAFRGRFSQAVGNILHRLAEGDDFGAHPSMEYISLGLVRNALATELDELCDADSASTPQKLMTSRHELRHDHIHPLFKNPRHTGQNSAETDWIRLAQDEPALADSIDPALGGRHFLTRGLGTSPDRAVSICHFEGREQELLRLTEWLDETPLDDSLRIVTGSPGMGKSALLGVLVCLMHPELQNFAHRFENRLRGELKPERRSVGQIAAIHARNRDLPELIVSIGRQLDPTEGIVTIDHLVKQIQSSREIPIIVLDALDEAIDPSAVQVRLLLRLALERRGNGDPLCRLLVGTRDEPRFSDLFAAAAQPESVIDLDDTDPQDLRENVRSYVLDLLRESSKLSMPAARAFASAVAGTVTKVSASPGQRVDVGPFLLAQIHTYRMIEDSLGKDVSVQHAAGLGEQAPTSIDAAFKSEFSSEENPWLMPLLTAFTRAAGSGIPLRHARSIARFTSLEKLPPISDVEVRDLIAHRARFYLRTDIDTDGSVLYALFHKTFQEHLLTESQNRKASIDHQVFEALRHDLGYEDDGEADWDNRLTPYLARNFGKHALDAGKVDRLGSDLGFLAHCDHQHVLETFRYFTSETARRTASVYRVSHIYHRSASPRDRLFRLALDAARIDDEDLFDRLRQKISPTPVTRWSTGRVVTYCAISDVRELDSAVTVSRPTRVQGHDVAIMGCRNGSLQIRDLQSGDLIRRIHTHAGQVYDIACFRVSQDPIAVSVSLGPAKVWSLDTGDLLQTIGRPTEQFVCVSMIEHHGHRILVAASADGTLSVFDMTTSYRIRELKGKRGATRSLLCFFLRGVPVVAATTDGSGTCIWNLMTGQLLHALSGRADQLTLTNINGRPALILAASGGSVRVWDIEGGSLETHIPLTKGVAAQLACSIVDGHPVLAVHGAYDNGWVGIWDLVSRKFVRELRNHRSAVRSIVAGEINGRPTLITAGEDQYVCWSDISVKPPVGNVVVPRSPITSLTNAHVDRRGIILAGGGDGSLGMWDAESRKLHQTIDAEDTHHPRGVASVGIVHADRATSAIVGYHDGAIRTVTLDPENRWINIRKGSWHGMTGGRLVTTSVVNKKFRILGLERGRLQLFDDDGVLKDSYDIADIESTDGILRRVTYDVTSMQSIEIDDTPAVLLCSSEFEGISGKWLRRQVRIYDLTTGSLLARRDSPGSTIAAWAEIAGVMSIITIGDFYHIAVLDVDPMSIRRIVGPFKKWHTLVCGRVEHRAIAVVGALDGLVAAFDLKSGNRVFFQAFPDGIRALAIARDRLTVAYGEDLCVVDFPGLSVDVR